MTPSHHGGSPARLSESDLEAMLARAAAPGPFRRWACWQGRGADDPRHAVALGVHPVRARTAVQTAVHVITDAALIALLTGIAIKLRWFGPNP